jgi:hypothetical protein
MSQRSQFVIANGGTKPLALNIEPEAVVFTLPKGEEVRVTDVFDSAPVTIKVSSSDRAEPVISIWPGDGEVTVEKDGVDVLDRVQSRGKVRSA